MRLTSLLAYNEIKNNGLLSKRKWEVYDILFKHGPLTAHEVVKMARVWHPDANQTSFNARLSELMKLGCVRQVGEKKNETSGMLNYLWDVTNSLPTKIKTDKKVQKCPQCNGKGRITTEQYRLDV